MTPGVSSGRSAALREKQNKTSFLATPFDVQTNMKDVSIGAGRGRTAERRRNGSDLHEVTPPGSQSASPEAEGGGGAAVRGNRKLLQSVRSDVNVSSTQRKKEKN